MATKKGSAKKAKKAPKKEEAATPETIELVDKLMLQVAASQKDNVTLQIELTKAKLKNLETENEQATETFNRLNMQANEKYNLVPGKDKLNLFSGEITRG